jgi:hypothetical protein
MKVLATQGPGWALTRTKLILSNKLGIIERRTPLRLWNDLTLNLLLKPGVPAEVEEYCEWRQKNSPRFFFGEISLSDAKVYIGENSIRLADGILTGVFPFFNYAQQLGFPPEWQCNPMSHATASGGHWSKIDEFQSEDIKLTWEASRFTWVFALGRAYILTRDERYADAFWQLFESWLDKNPPQWGINWKCGQETSFRVMALCFASYAFARSVSSTAARISRFVIAIAIHAKRIDAYLEYAQSQKNNHGISEGVGLWTIGLLFPELQGAENWRRRGSQTIERETRRQVYADGSYVQHSTNYHRVMLDDLAWAIRSGESVGAPLAPTVYEEFRKGICFLRALIDPHTGWAPNYGANDGALVLPLSDCVYPDMRPTLQCCYYIAEKEVLYPAGPWNEEMVWLNGLSSLNAKRASQNRKAIDLDARAGGYYTIRSGESWLMLRGTKYKDRPSHADQLHVDLWWHGENVLCDAGTYSYNSQPPFDDGFASTRYHNTVTVDGRNQMTRLGRFLWADWANANVRRYRGSSAEQQILEGEHDGYARFGVTHRRAVTHANAETWIVVDDLIGSGKHTARLQWLMPDVPVDVSADGIFNLKFSPGIVYIHLASNSESKFDLLRAGKRIAGQSHQVPDEAQGWISRYYARKEPGLSLVIENCSPLPIRFVTVIMLGKPINVEVSFSLTTLLLGSDSIKLSAIGSPSIFI